MITGTDGQDFIHVAGDGHVPPPGYNEIDGVSNLEEIVDAGAGDDIVYGGNGPDRITGGAGVDWLYGGGGNDIFIYRDLSDLHGLAEFIDGGTGDNAIALISPSGAIDISNATILNVSSLLAGPSDFGNLSITLTAEQLSGFSDSISGNGGEVDLILSAPGSVILDINEYSVSGKISGSAGNDQFLLSGRFFYSIEVLGKDGNDDIFLNNSDDNSKTTEYRLSGGEGNDNLSINFGLGDLFGGPGTDKLSGGKSANSLNGGSGKDRLTGGGGTDTLKGGSGSDTFVFSKIKHNGAGPDRHDTIVDFNSSDGDRINLEKMDADVTQIGDQAFFVGGSTFSSVAGELIQNSDGSGNLLLQGDVDGDGVADFEILLLGVSTISADSFIF